MEEVIEEFFEAQQEMAAKAAAASQEASVGPGGGGPPNPNQAIDTAESLSRGGIPGNEDNNIPAGAALPSLPGVMGGGPAQVA